MTAFIDWFVSLQAVRTRLIALGWKPPGPVTQGGGGPGNER